VASTAGKIELETLSDELPEERVVDRLLARAVSNVFSRWLDADDLDEIVEAFDAGLVMETGEQVRSNDYVRWMKETPGLPRTVKRLGVGDGSAAHTASAVEFVLEGLHLNRRLNKDRAGGGGRYRR
jgi:magnesium chelatase subunit I